MPGTDAFPGVEETNSLALPNLLPALLRFLYAGNSSHGGVGGGERINGRPVLGARYRRGRGRRDDPPALPGTGAAVHAGAPPGKVRRGALRLRAPERPGLPRAPPAVRGREARRN